jgi:diguanylate cyclase (GGDEF)-like protein
MLIAFSALFSGIAFSYSPENEFIRGPLGYTAFVVCGYYMILLVILSVREFHNRNASEAFIVIAIVCITVSSTILEAMGGFEGMINETGAVSITFYYLYFHTQQFKRDALTNALNRRCFYTDAARNFSSLSALVAIDLNNLKVLNDQKGHAEGDLAICTMVDCVQRVLLKNCYLYRTGGDEFMILCFKQSETRVKGMLAAIRTEMSKTSYTCALGMACMEAGKTLEKLCAQADAAMYQDKIEGKKLRNEPLRS